MTTWIVVIKAVVTFLVAYAIGCFSSAYFIGWIKKIDIREHGSGNAGSTNALRVMGSKAGGIVLLLDVIKGVIATFVGCFIFRIAVADGLLDVYSRYGIYLSGLAVIVGHNWPINLGFRGGKGVATTLGSLLILEPIIGLGYFVLAIICIAIFKMVSVVSLIAMLLFGATLIAVRLNTVDMSATESWIYIIYIVLLCALMVFTHRENLKRIFKGKENKTDLIGIIKEESKNKD